MDDESGERRSLAELAKDAAEAHQLRQARLIAKLAAGSGSAGTALSGGGLVAHSAQHPDATAAARGGTGSQGHTLAVEPPRPPPPLRMTGVYMGCLENRGGYFPIRDNASKW